MAQTSFIWDFDGTLVNSYPGILAALQVLYEKIGLAFNRRAIEDFILQESVGLLLDQLASQYELDRVELQSWYSAEHQKHDDQIVLMPYAKAVLADTSERGIQHFIYTHKGATTQHVLERLGIAAYFTEVVTAANGFARKPHPAGVQYLLDKYQLDPQQTYYIGDRKLDVEVAEKAGIHSLNLTQPDTADNQKLADLSAILSLF